MGEKEPNSNEDAKIIELEPDILQLRKEMRKQIKTVRRSASSPWIVIIPIAFFIIFFGFVLLTLLIIRV